MRLLFQRDYCNQFDGYGEKFKASCEKNDVEFFPVTVVPFEHSIVENLPSDINTKPLFIYGTNVWDHVCEVNGITHGLNDCVFDEISTLKNYGSDYINGDLIYSNTATYKDDIENIFDTFGQYVFLKPVDQKYFAGTITDKKMLPFVIESQGRYDGYPDEYDLIFSSIKHIKAEWRFFVVDRKIVTGSKYHAENLKLCIEKGYKEEAKDFAEKMIKKHMPGDCFAIDIAEMKDGVFKIVEINSINSSGIYEIDVDALVLALKEYLK